jgi:endonuclease/exonuclease/phosphatase family metal-dependent hydrolase
MLIRMIRQEHFDVMALQEIFLYRDIAYLVRQLPEYSNSGRHQRLFNRSGLLLLARQPLKNCTSVPFDMPYVTHEFPSHKGVLKSDVMLGGQDFQLVNTHLAYTPHSTDLKIQKRQLDQLARTLDTRPTFLFGDFNRVYDSLGLPPQFRLISEDKKSSISMSNRYARFFLNRVGMSDRLPDYIFTNFDVRVVKTYFITDPIMSDHYPVVSEVEM